MRRAKTLYCSAARCLSCKMLHIAPTTKQIENICDCGGELVEAYGRWVPRSPTPASAA